jgi:hypothetical protein
LRKPKKKIDWNDQEDCSSNWKIYSNLAKSVDNKSIDFINSSLLSNSRKRKKQNNQEKKMLRKTKRKGKKSPKQKNKN